MFFKLERQIFRYKSSEVHGVTRSGGLRWHQGEIQRIYDGADGKKRYDGKHTKGAEDGKWVSYKVSYD